MLRGLSQYRVLTRLARGGQGEVFLALDTRLNRRVCIKLYHYDHRPAERRRLELEAQRLASIQCHQVLGVYDVVAHGGRLALVTPYISGCSLEVLLRAQPCLSPAQAVAICSDIAAGLAALRRVQLVHGDLAARNILIDTGGRALLVDFGSALRTGGRPRDISDDAMSPEQLRGAPCTLASDLFSLGLLLHRMLVGKHPFFGDEGLDTVRMAQGLRDTSALASLPESVRSESITLLRDLLAPRPEERPSGTYELRERLRLLRAALPAPESLGPRTRTLEKRIDRNVAALPLVLPTRLVKLPWWRQISAALGVYWSRGSPGSRVLLASVVATPVVLAALSIVQRGPCIAISEPAHSLGAEGFPAAAGFGDLHGLVTEGVKRSTRRALVLGAGPFSDSLIELSMLGPRNVCTPRRHVDVSVDCSGDRCGLELVGRSRSRVRRSRMDLPRLASERDLYTAVQQLLEELAPILR